MAKPPSLVRKLHMQTEEGEAAQGLGRMIKGAVCTPNAMDFNTIVLYGWAGSDNDKSLAERTDTLVKAARLEELTTGKPATVITGDLNAVPKTLPTLHQLLRTGVWINAGSHQQ